MSKGFAASHRWGLLAILVLGSYCGIGARLVWLHVIGRAELLSTVEKARRQVILSPAKRGDILDDRGNILATSRSLMVVGVDPVLVSPDDWRKKTPRLAALLGMPLADLQKIMADRDPTSRWLKLGRVSEAAFEDIAKLGVKGVYGDRIYRRDYPHHELAAHVIGYVNSEEQPVQGIESFADFYLRGQDGWIETEKDGHRMELAQFRSRDVPAVNGCTVVLSIDSTVQHIVEAEMETIAKEFQPLKATIIVGDPRTGFILALANYPTFDLNAYNELRTREEQARMHNVAITDQYEPGSVFKIVAASGALDEGLVTPATQFDCTLDKILYNGRMRKLPREDASDHFTHPLSVAEIIAKSSNKGAAQLAMRLGDRPFYDVATAFGFGHRTGFPSERGAEIGGTLRPPDKWDGEMITRIPMGQSVAATVIQMHQAMGVIASGGCLLRPQLIREIRDAGGSVLFTFGRSEDRRVVSTSTARTMASLLERVASAEGTAPEAAIPGYGVAGKTGTAQKVIDGHYDEHHHVSSFVGFFPAEDPQVAITVVVDDADAHTKGGIGYGRLVAAPSFRRIGQQLISLPSGTVPCLNIKPAPTAAQMIALGGQSR